MDDTYYLDAQQLIDRALGASWKLGLSAGTELWATEHFDWDQHREYEEEKFLLRRELFRRLELLQKLLEQRDKAWKQQE